MHPLFWGPIGHDFILFMVSESYPDKPTEDEQKQMGDTLMGIFRFLPCVSPCSNKATIYVKENPLTLESKDALLLWLVTFHNDLNAKKIKPTKSNWTVLEALRAAHSRYGTSIRTLDRASQMRVEDHKMIQELLEDNNQMRTKLGLAWRTDIENTTGVFDENSRKQRDEIGTNFQKYFEPYDPDQWRIDVSAILVAVIAVLVLFVVMMAILG